LLKEVEVALEKKDAEVAKGKLAVILTENPNNPKARALQSSISERAPKVLGEAALGDAYRKPISIDFKDVTLKQVFDVISRTSNLNFLFDKDVRMDQKTSIFLKNSTIAAAVSFTLMTNQLDQQVLDANTILIYPNNEAKQRDYRNMVVRSFFLVNADAKVVSNTLKTILKSRDIVVDEKLNMLILRDSPEAIRIAEKLVALHDQAEPEVMLEVEILEVKRSRLLELGVQWPSSLTLTPLPSATGASLTLSDLNNLNQRTVGAGIGPVSIHARKEDGVANLLANPRIRARNHEKAKILIGERLPNITTTATSTGFVSESINYVDVGLKLEVEPTIFLDDDVAIRVSLEVSSLTSQLKTQSGSVAYQIGTRNATTVLRLKDGENQVLAGLINDDDRRTANKVPGFGELPVLGRLFGSTMDDSQKTEIVLSITPRLIRNIQRPEASLAEFGVGTENSLRIRTDTTSAVLPSTSPASANVGGGRAASGEVSTSPAPSNGNGATSPSAPSAINAVNPGTPANFSTPSGAGTPQLLWQGPKQVKVGDNLTVQLVFQPDQPVANLSMAVAFDPKVLQHISSSEGTFLNQGSEQTTFTATADASGQIVINGARSGTTGASNSGIVVVLTFRALTPTNASTIQVLNFSPISLAGRSMVAPLPAPFSFAVSP
jgi:general secretion pathway protein D